MPIGRDEAGHPVELDLKEPASGGMGPHGIMVGATGSGKSELLRSITAALAARHEPSLLNLLLIDFKGGAAFAGLEPLPHVAGLVTNLAEEPGLISRVKAALAGSSNAGKGCSVTAATSARSANIMPACPAWGRLDELVRMSSTRSPTWS